MKIDHQATWEKIRQVRPSVIAAHCGVTPPLVTAVINGTYPRMNAPKAQLVLDRLRELGVLVEVEDHVNSSNSRLAA